MQKKLVLIFLVSCLLEPYFVPKCYTLHMCKTLSAQIESSAWGCAQVCNIQKSCKSWIFQTDSSPAICITSYLSAAELVSKGCTRHQGTVIPQIISQELDQCLDQKYVNLPEVCKVSFHVQKYFT